MPEGHSHMDSEVPPKKESHIDTKQAIYWKKGMFQAIFRLYLCQTDSNHHIFRKLNEKEVHNRDFKLTAFCWCPFHDAMKFIQGREFIVKRKMWGLQINPLTSQLPMIVSEISHGWFQKAVIFHDSNF